MPRTIKTLLCVDDEPYILNALRRTLRKEAFVTLVASSGQEALQLMAQHPVDVVLSDQQMPEMTGTELLRQVRQKFPNTLRVLLSGYADTQVIEEAMHRGEVNWFLGKPWDEGELRRLLKDCLEQTENQPTLS